MIAVIATLAAATLCTAVVAVLAMAGFRAGDRPGDATVTAVPGREPVPDPGQRVIVVTVRNPGDVPVLAGLSVYRSRVPDWLTAGMSVTVPYRTARRRYRASVHAVLGVVGPGESAHWPVPAPAWARRCQLLAVIGQAGGRLRVVRLPVSMASAWTAVPGGEARLDPLFWIDGDLTP